MNKEFEAWEIIDFYNAMAGAMIRLKLHIKEDKLDQIQKEIEDIKEYADGMDLEARIREGIE